MSSKFYVFGSETEAREYAAKHGAKARVAYRGDYRQDWLVSVAE